MTLAKYKQKRNFKKTPEPAGKLSGKRRKLSFVIQKHDATRLHYDFRLEMEGVLKSWAVPKGPSLNPNDKRLAIMVEDHPLAYGKFIGIIPEGNYGAGEVEIWDAGHYTALEKSEAGTEEKQLLHELHEGNIKFTLHGKLLKGNFALVKMKDASQENQWLLIKKDDDHAVHKKYDSNTVAPLKPLKRKPAPAKKTKITGKRKAVKTKTIKKKAPPDLKQIIRPMLAKIADEISDEQDYAFEYKWDGYRCITTIINGEVNLYSRKGLLFNSTFSPLLPEFKTVHDDVVLDGEIVAVNKRGAPEFQPLQNNRTTDTQLRYYLFDLLYLNGETITDLPFLQRNELLNLFFKKYDFKKVFISKLLTGSIGTLLNNAAKKGLEGIIAKRSDSIYAPGKRTPAWLKLKIFNTQSAVICGFTAPQGSRAKFGALVLGIYEDDVLHYIGHCGTGFTERLLHDLHKKMSPLITKKCPFPKVPETNQPTTWLKPLLICEVKFTEWTGDGVLRHPVFRGLREDLNIKDVGKEPVKPQHMATKKIPAGKEKNADGNSVVIKGKSVSVTNPDKIYWPKEKYTKGDMIRYYTAVAPYLFPYLKDRPMSMNRFPNGIDKPSFYQKDVEVSQLPSWVATEAIYSESNDKDVDYIVCKNEATIIYMANLGCIELNPWNSRVGKLDRPDYIVIDIDPGEIEFKYVVKTALETKKVCDEFGITCYCKTSGATGLHVYIPLHAKYNYEQGRQFAALLARIIHERTLDFTSIERSVSKRRRKIYIDFLQNSRGQTLASVFSIRPRPGATISTPLEWKEVNARLDPKKFTIKNILRSMHDRNELFMPVLKESNNLKKILEVMS